jgi:hypothetical protein
LQRRGELIDVAPERIHRAIAEFDHPVEVDNEFRLVGCRLEHDTLVLGAATGELLHALT